MALKKISCIGLITGLLLLCSLVPLWAMADGAYTIGCNATYANPLTGKTVDGGTNIALGDSMAASIVEKQLLVEQVNGKLYVTIGLGLASNISNVRFMVMNPDGSMHSSAPTLTGHSSANGDSVNHYRIEIQSLDQYISPIIYVTPMGRDVQFFIQLNAASIAPGVGIYNSLLVPSASTQPANNAQAPAQAPVPTQSTAPDKANDVQEPKSATGDAKKEADAVKNKKGVPAKMTKSSLFKGVFGMSVHKAKEVKKKQGHLDMYFTGGVVLIVIVVAGGYFYVKKIKK